jgi:extracellular factor (EF) 3-hydroxypalmitic acid methyl ester biosynthesis protein
MTAKRGLTDSVVAFVNSQGSGAQGVLIHLNRHIAVFEVYNPYSIVQLSEVLTDVRIRRGEREIYNGKAVVTNIVNTGLLLIVSASLVDPWSDLANLVPGDQLRQEVDAFVDDWRESHGCLLPTFKESVNDIRNFMMELRTWLEHGEVALGIAESGETSQKELDFTENVDGIVTPRLFDLYMQFEEASRQVPRKFTGPHSAYVQRELHPLVMCSPFVCRSITKPLGYAGDYEMVNMMLRDPREGANTYARIINASVLRHDAPRAHRNRIILLQNALERESERAASLGLPLDVLNVGCGPAEELKDFIGVSDLSNRLNVTLMDFNQETLKYAEKRIKEACRSTGRSPKTVFVHKSINDLIREATLQVIPETNKYDLVYCAGLFDYLGGSTCECLIELFYHWVRPGGVVVVTNVTPNHSSTGFMKYLLEWNLKLRDPSQMLSLATQFTQAETYCDETGVNVFLSVRKPRLETPAS